MREKRCSFHPTHLDEWISPVQSQNMSTVEQSKRRNVGHPGEGEDSNGTQRYNQVLNAFMLHKGHCHLIAHVEQVSGVDILVGMVKKKAKDRKL